MWALGPSMSGPLEHRRLLGDEGAVGALEVARLHADRLGLRFRFDGLIETHRPFLIELGLDDAGRKGRAEHDAPRELEGLASKGRSLDQPIVEAPAFAFRGRHGAPG